jgi:sialate O-acetylesterase
MKNIKHLHFLFLLIALQLITCSATAKLILPQIIGNNMVLQQNTTVKIWGWANPGTTVTIISSWDRTPISVQVANDSSWVAKIKTPTGSYTTRTLEIHNGKEKLTLSNILIGEVWFCSGQSNMEMPIKGFTNCPVQGSIQEICMAGKYKEKVRVVKIPRTAAPTPQKEVDGDWKIASPETAPNFSATAWFFATTLNEAIDLPIGIIDCNWGGSRVEGWLNEATLKTYPDIDLSKIPQGKTAWYTTPLVMYNGMLHPLENYTIRGFLWYQGESNVGHHDTYTNRMATMINLWRSEWGEGNLPFYYVEIAPFDYGGVNGAYLREAQYKIQKMVPNCGMISTNDLVESYEKNQIHPHQKKAVGQRLCYMALHNTYGEKSIPCVGPVYKSMNIDGNKASIKFDNDEDGFNRSNGIIGFEIAGADKVFYPAQAILKNRTIIVTSTQVETPVAVRYCFRDFQPGNLASATELPVVPFRTDNW